MCSGAQPSKRRGQRRDFRLHAELLQQGLLLSLAGVAIGLALAVGLTRFMAGLLFGVRVTDPLTYLVVAAGLTAVALGASYLPARRAGRVDPIVALSAE